MLKVIFFGRELGILEELYGCSHVQAVYFQPPGFANWKPRNLILRYRKTRQLLGPLLSLNKKRFRKWLRILKAYAVYDFALSKRIEIMQYPRVSDHGLLSAVAEMKPDLGVVANFEQKVPEKLYGSARFGFVNFHPSLLPKYRGPSPYERVLLNGELQSGVTFHQIATDFDTGGILCQETLPVMAHDSIQDLMSRSVTTARRMLADLLCAIENGSVTVREQNELEATYFGKLTRQERQQLGRILRRRHELKNAGNLPEQ